MAYRQRGRNAYQTDVTDRRGRTRKGCSCGTDDATEAAAVDDAVRKWRRKSHELGGAVLAAIVDGEIALADAFEAEHDGRLEAFWREHQAAKATAHAAREAAASVVDLAPMVAEWAEEQGIRSSELACVRRFIPEGVVFPATEFRRGRIAAFLGKLRTVPKRAKRDDETDEAFLSAASRPAAGGTRNRYRAAIRAFGTWLLEREVIDAVPVVKGFAEADPRMTYLDEKQAKMLVARLAADEEHGVELGALAALMANGVEWGALPRAIVADVHRTRWTFQPFAPRMGQPPVKGKNRWRAQRRALHWTWTRPYIAAWLDTRAPDAPLTISEEGWVLDQQVAACAALGLPRHTLHDWRHTQAVWLLTRPYRRGDPATLHERIALVRRQLGHAPNSMVALKVYAAIIDTIDDSHGEPDGSSAAPANAPETHGPA